MWKQPVSARTYDLSPSGLERALADQCAPGEWVVFVIRANIGPRPAAVGFTNVNLRSVELSSGWSDSKPRRIVGTARVESRSIDTLFVDEPPARFLREFVPRTVRIGIKDFGEFVFTALQPEIDRLKRLIDDQSTQNLMSESESSSPDRLEEFARLQDAGVLTDDEFKQAKSLVIGRAPSAADELVHTLDSLYELHRRRVLTESEFRTKKWEVLSRPGP